MKSTSLLLSSMLLAATVTLAQAQTTPNMNRDSTGTPQAANEVTDVQANQVAKPAKKAKKTKRGNQADAAAHRKATEDGATKPKDMQPSATPAQ